MMWWNGSGWAWLWMSVMMVAFWGGVGALIFLVVRSGSKTLPEARSDPEDILAERFARGEISAEEFHERKKVLAKR